jgi:hypothetical protein
MDLSLKINDWSWKDVYKIPMNTPLIKGRHGLYHEIVKAAGEFQNRFGCYAWGTSSDRLLYVGSFSQDYQRGNYKSNLHGRIHNYLQNHRLKGNGRKNTNLMVFENIGQALLSYNVTLYIFAFDFLIIGQDVVDYAHYSEDGELVRAVEQLLITFFRRHNQCAWNRE